MRKYLLLILVLVSGCAGVGLVATSDPDEKIQQAYVLMAQDRAILAKDLIGQALKTYEETGNKLGMAEAYHAYGNLYISNSNDSGYVEAINSFKKSQSIFNEAGSEIGVIKSMVGIANSSRLRNENSKACAYYKSALSRYELGKENGEITSEPVIMDKRFKNMGQIIESYIEHDKCRT